MKTNLVIPCYGGERASCKFDEIYNKDRGHFIKRQIEYLSRIKHNLTQITFVNNFYGDESKEYRNVLMQIPEKINNSNVVMVERNNKGISYSAFSDVVNLYKDEFDYYFLIEDDHIFVLDDFDSLLIDKFNLKENCGYLGMEVITRLVDGFPHVSIASGVTSFKILNNLLNKFNKHIYELYNSNMLGAYHQVSFSKAFLDCGFDLYDIQDSYLEIFYESSRNELKFCGDINNPLIEASEEYLRIKDKLILNYNYIGIIKNENIFPIPII